MKLNKPTLIFYAYSYNLQRTRILQYIDQLSIAPELLKHSCSVFRRTSQSATVYNMYISIGENDTYFGKPGLWSDSNNQSSYTERGMPKDRGGCLVM